jgi:hypothetical protein
LKVLEAFMTCTTAIRSFVTAGAIAATVVLTIPGTSAQKSTAERFTAFAVDIGSPGRSSAGVIEVVVERYSTNAEADRLMNVLLEKGPEQLLDTIRELPRVGFFRTPGNLGWDVKFARKVPGEDGGETISLMTDRYISFWEAANRPRTIDYPFTLIELRIGANGQGEGKMSLATKIAADKKRNTIILEDYKTQPVLLKNIKRETTTD